MLKQWLYVLTKRQGYISPPWFIFCDLLILSSQSHGSELVTKPYLNWYCLDRVNQNNKPSLAGLCHKLHAYHAITVYIRHSYLIVSDVTIPWYTGRFIATGNKDVRHEPVLFVLNNNVYEISFVNNC